MSGGKGGGGAQTVTNQTVLPPFIQQGATQNLAFANQVADRPYDSYSGQTIAGFTPDQQAAMDWVRNNFATGGNAITAAGAPISGSNLTTTAQSLLNPYLDQVQTNAVNELQRSSQMSQNDLAAKAASAGAFGGTRFGVQSAELASDTARQAGELTANIRSQGWNTAVDTALKQATTSAQIANAAQTAGLQGVAALANTGAAQQNQAQTELNDAIQKWQAARDYPLEQLAIKESALGSTPYGGTSTSTQPLNRGNTGLTALSGAGTGAALGTALSSALALTGGAAGAATGGGAAIGALLALL